jgi:hypothetical protein
VSGRRVMDSVEASPVVFEEMVIFERFSQLNWGDEFPVVPMVRVPLLSVVAVISMIAGLVF